YCEGQTLQSFCCAVLNNNDEKDEMRMIVIVEAVRTAMGGFQGSLSSCTAPDLGAVAIKDAVARAGLAPSDIDEVIMGCVLPAGLKQGPARQAMRQAGLPD